MEYIRMVFENFVDTTEPVCQALDPKKSGYLLYDTSGSEANVKENNPKFINSKINNAKKFAAKNPEINAHALAYSQMPAVSETNPFVNQQYMKRTKFVIGISATRTNSVLSPMDSVLFAIFLFLMKISNVITPKSFHRKLTTRTLTKKSAILLLSNLFYWTSSPLTRISGVPIILFSAILLLINMIPIPCSAMIFTSIECAFPLIRAIPALLMMILMKTELRFVL
jgi:hypothetical protein